MRTTRIIVLLLVCAAGPGGCHDTSAESTEAGTADAQRDRGPGGQDLMVADRRLHDGAPPDQAWPLTDGRPPDLPAPKPDSAPLQTAILGDHWPALVFVLDRSKSMDQQTLGSSTKAFGVLQQIMQAWISKSFPARCGVVLYNDTASLWAAPPKVDTQNTSITKLLAQASPTGNSAAAAGLSQAATLLAPTTPPRDVVLITSTHPTAATGCAQNSSCCISQAQAQAQALRSSTKASVHTVEIRASGYSNKTTQFLTAVAGKAGSTGNNKAMHYNVQSTLGIQAFINSLTRSLCALGPVPQLTAKQPPAQLKVAIRYQSVKELDLPRVANRDAVPTAHAYEYYYSPKGEVHILLTMHSCSMLGANAPGRLVVRWSSAAP